MSSFSLVKNLQEVNDPFQKIVWLVLALHLLFLLFLNLIATGSTIAPIPKKMTVLNVQLAPKKEESIKTSAPTPPVIDPAPYVEEIVYLEQVAAPQEPIFEKKEIKPPPPQPLPRRSEPKPIKKSAPARQEKVASPVKKPAVPIKPKAKPLKKIESAPKAVPEKKEQVQDAQRAMLKQALDKMKKVDTGKVAYATSSKEVKTIASIGDLKIDNLALNADASLTIKELAYRDELAHRLKLLLKLPEFGEVKLKLTVERSGKVAHLNILHSVSRENKLYIEKTLPTLKMPPFGENFAKEQNYSFTITLSHQ